MVSWAVVAHLPSDQQYLRPYLCMQTRVQILSPEADLHVSQMKDIQYIYMYIIIYICIYVCVYTYINTKIDIYTCTRNICVCVCTYMCVYVCVCVCVYVCVYIYMQTRFAARTATDLPVFACCLTSKNVPDSQRFHSRYRCRQSSV